MADDTPHTKKTVVLIDDDDFLLDMYSVKFKERGLVVQAFQNVDDALGFLRSASAAPDLIVTDMVMPVKDGFAFLAELRDLALSPPPVVVVLSNQGQDEDMEKAQSLGAHGYIVKANAIPSEIITMCLNLLSGKSAERGV